MDLFTQHEDYQDNGLVSNVIPSLVTEEENCALTSVPLSEEIWAVVKSMDLDSAPGPDGFSGQFFVSCWEIVGADVIMRYNISLLLDDLSDMVSSFISNGSWDLPQLLHFYFPSLCDWISQVPIAADPSAEDKLIWTASSSGELTAKHAYIFLRQPSPSVAWGKSLWSKFILPRMSLLAWKVLRGRVISDDFLQRRGVALVSRCDLCGIDSESLDHIFLNCSFTAAIWSHFTSLFELGGVPPSILEGLQVGMAVGRSGQLKDLWLICFTSILWFVWNARNKMRHEGKVFSVGTICRLVSCHIQAASRLATGTMHNSIQDLRILK
ncbi:uncharacterized protein LOC133731445 [Rosa rugosa]|uniref:uncharacterized protein LOC133731445 n=1 Tax=Rosa rugosa TaxID=74645 RepID=UPI002B40A46A|nr:uncharacterized protein LOC133731445 [Rosa rugosa]